ncbi:MAG: putative RNA 2'-phosphotransferase [Planctomycetota bacterium]
MSRDIVRVSKFLSLILRHEPDRIGLALDSNGWADIEELIQRADEHGVRINRELLDQVVAENDKQRFAISGDGLLIRANQGHSIEVELNLSPTPPPNRLFHGTATRFIDSIRSQGLIPGQRRHVHLSPDETTARKVGRRHGEPVVLEILAGRMASAGHVFYLSENGVWLTDCVPAQFIQFPTG